MSIDITTLRPKLEAALGEQLQLGPLLGQGGFAAVFRARDPFLERDVAIKVLDPSLALDAALEEQFLHEARTIAAAEHPHIVPLYSAESNGGLLYLVMRLLPGQSLVDRIAEGKLAPADAARIALECARALAAALRRRRRAPRHQAGEHPARRQRQRDRYRLRDRARDVASVARARRIDDWYAAVHESRAVARRADRWTVGRLRVRRRALRDAHGRLSIRGAQRDGSDRETHLGADPQAIGARTANAGGARQARGPHVGQGPSRATHGRRAREGIDRGEHAGRAAATLAGPTATPEAARHLPGRRRGERGTRDPLSSCASQSS